MLTLSLVFEERDDNGMLTDYRKYDLDPNDGVLYASLIAYVGSSKLMGMDEEPTLTEMLLHYISRHDPDVFNEPAASTVCPLCSRSSSPEAPHDPLQPGVRH